MTPSEFAGISLGLGVVRGVRSFDVDPHGRLMGINYKVAWKPGENEAKCLLDPYSTAIKGITNALSATYTFSMVGGGNITIPKATGTAIEKAEPSEKATHSLDTCSCGFYAYYDGSNDYKSDARISAVVEGYGETLIGTRGFRASKARIAALCIPETKAKRPRIHWLTILWAAVACIFMALGIFALINGKTVAGWIQVGGAVAYAGCAVLNVWARRDDRSKSKTDPIPAEMLAKVRRNYPDVPVFTSFKAMVAAFPPDKGLEPSPDSDPRFWER